jgi:2'-5' RNA ligase
VPEAGHRLFVAVPLPDDALAACGHLIEGVRSGPEGRGARWVRTANLHLTLRFLGPTPPDLVASVVAGVRSAVTGRPSFRVRLAGAGAFPSLTRPRALWLGIDRGAVELAAIAASLDKPLEALGWPPETRPFRAHLTVARTDASAVAQGSAAATTLAAAAAGWSVAFDAEQVVVYRSHLRAGPPIYEPISQVALAG